MKTLTISGSHKYKIFQYQLMKYLDKLKAISMNRDIMESQIIRKCKGERKYRLIKVIKKKRENDVTKRQIDFEIVKEDWRHNWKRIISKWKEFFNKIKQ